MLKHALLYCYDKQRLADTATQQHPQVLFAL